MKKRLLPGILALILIAAMLAGCGASASSGASPQVYDTAADAYGYSYSESAMAAAEMPTEEYAGSYNMQKSTSNPALENAKLIYTADIGLETTAFDTAVSELTALVSELGGYFESSSIDSYGAYRSGYYTVRVPAEQFDEMCTRASSLCQLNYINRSAQDVSETYYDTESRLTTQQTKLERLQELLSKAESMEDIITIESAISDTEQEIEQLTGTLRRYDSLVGYSTVSITLSEVYRLSDIEEPAIGFGAKLVSALKQGCRSFVSGLESLALGIAYGWIGYLILLIIIIVVARFVIIRAKRRRAGGVLPTKQTKQPKEPDGEDKGE